jgi:hypothetical protein
LSSIIIKRFCTLNNVYDIEVYEKDLREVNIVLHLYNNYANNDANQDLSDQNQISNYLILVIKLFI